MMAEPEKPEINRNITISGDGITVEVLAQKLGVGPNLVVKKLLDGGIFAMRCSMQNSPVTWRTGLASPFASNLIDRSIFNKRCQARQRTGTWLEDFSKLNPGRLQAWQDSLFPVSPQIPIPQKLPSANP